MRLRLFLLIFFLTFSVSGCAGFVRFTQKRELTKERREAVSLDALATPVLQFSEGEKLEYDIRWMGMSVGTGRLEIQAIEPYEGRQVFHIVMRTESNWFLSSFYPVKDEIHTYIDTEKLIPYKFRKIQREGGYRADEEMRYDQENHKASYRSLLNNSSKEMEIPPAVQDSLSTLYYFRTLPLEMGKSVFIDVNADEKNWRLEIQVLKSGLLALHGKEETPAFLVEPLAKFHGVFIRKGRMQIWFSLDKRRIPLYMKANIPFGIVEVVLKKRL
ncbi:MAG: DUF3108 domain-containing protein [Candidatus Omnitrophota bacterium]